MCSGPPTVRTRALVATLSDWVIINSSRSPTVCLVPAFSHCSHPAPAAQSSSLISISCEKLELALVHLAVDGHHYGHLDDGGREELLVRPDPVPVSSLRDPTRRDRRPRGSPRSPAASPLARSRPARARNRARRPSPVPSCGNSGPSTSGRSSQGRPSRRSARALWPRTRSPQ